MDIINVSIPFVSVMLLFGFAYHTPAMIRGLAYQAGRAFRR